MKKKNLTSLWLIAATLLFTIPVLWAQPTPVKELIRKAPQTIGKIVEVQGLVYQLIEPENNFMNYMIRDDYGTSIKIHTDGKAMPETNKKYNVRGYFVIDNITNQPYIMETYRMELVTGQIVETKIDKETLRKILDDDKSDDKFFNKYFWYLVILAGALIIAVILLLVFRRRAEETETRNEKITPPGPARAFQGAGEAKPEDNQQQKVHFQKDDLNTMVIPKDMPKTLKFFPAELEVTKGADTGKKFKIAGFPREDGMSVVTIGREDAKGPGDYAHIQLKERTISRKQAEIIQKDGKVFIKNLSETNYTKVNGEDLAPNTSKELNGGEVLGFGEVEMKYNKA